MTTEAERREWLVVAGRAGRCGGTIGVRERWAQREQESTRRRTVAVQAETGTPRVRYKTIANEDAMTAADMTAATYTD